MGEIWKQVDGADDKTVQPTRRPDVKEESLHVPEERFAVLGCSRGNGFG